MYTDKFRLLRNLSTYYQTTSLWLVGDKIEIIGRQQIKLSCLATRIPRIARGRMTSHRQVSTSFQTEGHP
jgi:hypothetical protein